ncbi:ATP-binding protein, partial [Pseudomonas aeruginosa]
PSGMPYSSFLTQEAIISAMVAHHGNAMGITERTLQAKFALARRNLQSTTS